MSSLRLRLVLLLSVGLGLAWATSAWFSHVEARREIDALFDAQLAQSARVLLGTTRHDLHERIEHGVDDIQASHAYEQQLVFQMWANDGLLLRSATAPDQALASQEQGYSETRIAGQPWRVFTRWDNQHEVMIQIAEPLAGRERLARHIALKMLLPSLLALPILALLIWFAVGGGLQPLKRLRSEVKQRTAERLEPITLPEVPDEVLPLVQAINELFVRLQQSFEGERRFTADAAHELRTPLAALKTQTQVALRATEEDERRSALNNVLRGVDRATHLLEQLLALARVDPMMAASGHEPVELRGLAARTLSELATDAHAKQIDLALEDGPALNIPGNPAQLDVLMRNLVDNAIRYTPSGGSVSVSLQEDKDGVILEVRDTGPGIPETEREHVLQRFYRIPGSIEEGSGLGLSIARRIAELHHARLDLGGNVAGQGLRARVVFTTNSSSSV